MQRDGSRTGTSLPSAANSVQFQYALCWLDARTLSPVLQLCWARTSFRDLLAVKAAGRFTPTDDMQQEETW